MAPCSSKNLKTKEVKIPHLMVANQKKMETWGLGGLFEVDWNGTYEHLVEELAERKVAMPKYEYHGKPEEWTSKVWREVYNLPKASLGGYTMKGKVQFTELQMLRVVKGDRRLKHFHHAWEAITNLVAPTPNWGDVVEKTMSRQIKALGVCNEATCIGPYLAHLYSHSMRWMLRRRRILRSKIDYDEWGIRLESLGHETSKLFEAFHVEVGSVIAEAMARNMREMFAPPPVAEADIQPWKEMVKNLANLLTEEQKRNKAIVEQRDYFEGKTRRSKNSHVTQMLELARIMIGQRE
ncbi:hypothetical protein R1flu_025518 [Riccia fluitans]|uniref:Uncharacterized protein n=1 Tax=Riccia fluitans TaxID=41844 RepID=A0ABD1Y126_9MARC